MGDPCDSNPHPCPLPSFPYIRSSHVRRLRVTRPTFFLAYRVAAAPPFFAFFPVDAADGVEAACVADDCSFLVNRPVTVCLRRWLLVSGVTVSMFRAVSFREVEEEGAGGGLGAEGVTPGLEGIVTDMAGEEVTPGLEGLVTDMAGEESTPR